MTPDEKAQLILRALSGEHLHGFLPGEDHKAAISHAVSTHHGWAGGDQYGRVTKRGIETFSSVDEMYSGPPTLVIPWSEVLDIVAQGCTDQRREDYEAAYARWCGWVREDGYTIKSSRTSAEEREASYQRWSAASHGIYATTAAIINAGCERQTLQPELF
jgi:hypothetical protein